MKSKEQLNSRVFEKAEKEKQFNEMIEILQSIRKFAESSGLKFEELAIKQNSVTLENPGLILNMSFRHEDTEVKMETINKISEKMKEFLAKSKWGKNYGVYPTGEHKIEMKIDITEPTAEN